MQQDKSLVELCAEFEISRKTGYKWLQRFYEGGVRPWRTPPDYVPGTLTRDKDILPYRIDPDIAIININRGVLVLEPLGAEIPVHLPRISLPELECLPDLALAVKLAALKAEHAIPAGASPSAMIREGWDLRKKLMPVVSGLATTGAIPQEAYDNIAAGRGVRDMAEDCVALSQVFYTYHAEVAGKHSADAVLITRAETVGSWLLKNLSKKNASQPIIQSPEEDIRDRMATLLVNRYNRLRAVSFYFHGEQFARHVPA